MPLAGCARCKKMFGKTASPVCPACQADEDADIEKVRKLVRTNPDLNGEELAERAEVDFEVVQRMIRGGILMNTVVAGGQVKCGRCGGPAISASKKLCQPCLDKLNMEVAQAQAGMRLGARKPPQIGASTMNVRKALETKRQK